MSFRSASIITAIAIMATPVAGSAQSSGPAARIAGYDAKINAIETAHAALPARIERFTPLVRDYYAMDQIAALVAGPAWARASAADRGAAVAALTRHSATSLAKSFKGPGATHFAVDPAVIDRGGTKVVKVTAGSDTLFYRMDRAGTRIVDVISGGVSQLALQRADLQTTLASGGIPAMVKRLGELDRAK